MAGRKPDVTDEEIIEVLREASDPALTTSEVADKLPIKSNATHRRLSKLKDNGRIQGKKPGHDWVWWAQ